MIIANTMKNYNIWLENLRVQKLGFEEKNTTYLPIGTDMCNKSFHNEEIKVCGEYMCLGVVFYVSGNDNREITRIFQA